ncbi:MAG TPA: FecR domain-containing protein, partial [Pseudomonadota bacterium]|nr:FecR domain-containing protein [Pseudomonadota bacterium]
MTCPSSISLSRAFSSGASRDLQAHLLTCPTCTAEWKRLEQTRAAALELPYVTPDPLRREQLRKRLLAAASQALPVGPSVGPSVRARWLGFAGAAAALLAVLMGARRLTRPAPASHFRAVVQSQGASHFVHERTGSDEWVRLSDGTLNVEVEPLQPGERFRVLCGDSAVEVRGTAFTTRVEHDHLLSVD